jgi:hypothetical protein
MAATSIPARRRRARRGSLERPVNTRLYRGSFAVVLVPLLLLAFSFVRPSPLPAPTLPPNFDGNAAATLANDLSEHFPDRAPGGTGSIRAAQWFTDQLRQYNLRVSSDTWSATIPGFGRQHLVNLWAIAPGQSRSAIVVIAHRDDTGAGPGADDDASGTAALVELARGYAQASATSNVRSAHAIVFLSTDGGAFGGLGAARFVSHAPFPIVAVVNLAAIGGPGGPRIEIAGDTPRSPAIGLVETAARRIAEQTGTSPGHAGIVAQLVDLAFPFTLYEQGPFVARGIPAVTLTTAGARPPAAFTDRTVDTARLGQMGRAAQQLIGSLDQGLGIVQGATSFVWTGGRIVRGWAIELVLFALLIPFLVTVVDLFAHCRRRGIPVLPALRSLRSRIGLWLFAGAMFYVLRWLGAWPTGASRPPSPAAHVAGDWRVLSLLLLAAFALGGWVVTRPRLAPRRRVVPEERLAGETAALLTLGVVALLVLATSPFTLLFLVPALHVWLWLPQLRMRRGPGSAIALVAGLAGPAVVLLSLALRFGLGFDAPWYLLVLVSVGYVSVPAVALCLVGAACVAQLAAVTANRYAPYPERDERPARGPLRELVRRLVLASRTRRRVTAERRRAFGG